MPDNLTEQQTPNQQRSAPDGATQSRDITVEVRGQGGVTASAVLHITSLTDRARFKRAGKTSAMLFGLAICSLPIPPIHWVLVPGFLLASVIAFFVRMGTSELITGEVQCPKCQKTFALESQPPTWPMELTCHSCRAQLSAAPPK